MQTWSYILSMFFMYTSAVACICAIAHMHDTMQVYLHALTVRIYMHIYKINGGKLIQFIAFTYWPESLLQGGIMADWVCTKTGEEKGRVEEGEGKKMETCLGDIRVTRWGLKKKKSMVGCFCMKKKKENSQNKNWGSGDLQV